MQEATAVPGTSRQASEALAPVGAEPGQPVRAEMPAAIQREPGPAKTAEMEPLASEIVLPGEPGPTTAAAVLAVRQTAQQIETAETALPDSYD